MLGHNRKMSGAECLADMLKGYGVTHVFHVPAVLRKTMAVMEGRTEIKRLHVHGEKAAAYMADGYARASGKPGICAAQVIGALNLAAGLRDAWLAHSPVIAMTGGREPKTKFRKVYQEIDDVPAFEPVTKFNATVDDVARFPDMVRQAFRVATSGTPGPVHLQFRGNEGQIDAEEAEMEPLCEPQFARVPPYRPMPDDASVMSALKHLQESQRPVIVAGGGVRASGASAELVALAQALQIPVATSLNGKDAIAGNHPLSVGVVGTYSRESANRVVNSADLVCFIGTETGDPDRHRPGGDRPQLSAPRRGQRRCQSHARAHAWRGRSRQRRQTQSLGRGRAKNLQGMVGEVPLRPELRCRTDPSGAHLRGAHSARAGQWHRRGRHRSRRHVDGWDVRSHQP
jgi:acetolactate synthase-1/2/3 large subunit